MSLKVPKAGTPIFKDGYKISQGIEDAVLRNIEAASELSGMLRTSFGPNGKNKIVINHLSRTFVTSDSATILRELDVVHPIGKLLVLASQQQEAELGDGSALVVMLAGELLQKAAQLITLGLHPTEVLQGYELARDKAVQELEDLSVASLTSPPTVESLALAIRPALASKQYGQEDLLAPLVAQAVSLVLPQAPSGTGASSSSSAAFLKDFNVDNVRVVKIMGGSLSDSRVVRGMVFGRTPEGVVRKAEAAKVAVFTCGLDISQTETKGTVLLHNAKELSTFSHGEEKSLELIIRQIADSGVKVVVTGSTVGELAMHYLNRFGILVIKILSKFELRRLSTLLGATPLARMGPPTPEEAGWVDVVETTEIGGDRVTVFRQEEGKVGGKAKPRMATVVLRGATANLLDDVERAVDDGVNVIKALTRDARLVPGAGATEVELSRRVTEFGEKMPGLNQHAIRKFAEALEVVPRTLAENAGLDATETVSAVFAKHANKDSADVGIDIDGENDGTVATTPAQIFDVLAAKHWALRYATGAAVQVLSVDSIIMSKPAGIKVPQQKGWDED
ncbi:putative CCT8-component of chaperonin-containing T-complex [Ceraceosorus guamensis]|uniref:CCT-theta n=1 Tax=Ceraceosorus guamensis TaxID=1522189 RepID=A0A316VSN0_9BASI|nr:putative CCT8-component of chaperonin-containing T-complex [Ceraceosorus guamensis]PWN40380.1 putative CCT8-component of chaperonin-containing T-complex [Ceraceosorus guamensis]